MKIPPFWYSPELWPPFRVIPYFKCLASQARRVVLSSRERVLPRLLAILAIGLGILPLLIPSLFRVQIRAFLTYSHLQDLPERDLLRASTSPFFLEDGRLCFTLTFLKTPALPL